MFIQEEIIGKFYLLLSLKFLYMEIEKRHENELSLMIDNNLSQDQIV